MSTDTKTILAELNRASRRISKSDMSAADKLEARNAIADALAVVRLVQAREEGAA